jgi:hypothetical protein
VGQEIAGDLLRLDRSTVSSQRCGIDAADDGSEASTTRTQSAFVAATVAQPVSSASVTEVVLMTPWSLVPGCMAQRSPQSQ